MGYYPHEFDAEVATHDVGSDRYRYTVLWLPKALHGDLPLDEFPRLRIDGEINGVPHNGALTPVRGRWYLLLSAKVLKRCGLKVGANARVVFRIADQDAIDVPRELQFAIEANSRAEKTWNSLTPGKQRGFAYRVASAKRPETREKRVEEVLESLLELAD